MVTFQDRVKFFTPSIEVPYMNQIIKVKDNHKENLPDYTYRWFNKSTNITKR